MKSILLINLGLLTLIFILIDYEVSITFIIFAIATIENSISVSNLSPKNSDFKIRDFRFLYAQYASKIYYSLSVLISYCIYLAIKNYLITENISIDKVDYLFLTIIFLFFIVFRVLSQETSTYLENKNLFETKDIQTIKNDSSKRTIFKELIIKETNSWVNLTEDLESRSLLRNLINTLKYSSIEFDQRLLDQCQNLTKSLRDSISKDQINIIVKNILSTINN